ncbi:TraB/GumN family protein [Notoacmeibacter ruber]|uniref:Polysaccharide biosynthesis protein GumN n=1 Tax=Notoacmeibacter ruber TaxID=2670375 RepID=A0A3L7JFG4_9HYPH|nr:TraB/GumN family protein [Notoacmeibacter ruber]RLQ89065.1 polysaccharide biosynthesis protein GumN [Notoacmeibacter ruber]
MTMIHAYLSRISGPVIIFASAVHGLLFLAFLASLILLDPQAARAAEEPPRCEGRDLYAELQKTDPEAAAEAERTFAATPNNKGLFWRIEKEGAAPSHLFGTIHTTDPRTLTLPKPVGAALDEADVFVMETADARSKLSASLAMARHPSLFVYTDGKSAFDELDEEQAKALRAALAKRDIDPSTATKLKPWLIVGMLAAPPCELKRKAAGLEFLDNTLADRAEEDGKDIEGLESMVDQMRALADMPMESHLDSLANAAEMDDYAADMVETLTIRYLNEDTGLVMPALEAIGENIQGPLSAEQQAAAAAFEKNVLTGRNHTMADAAEPLLADGNAFIAIGALHLPGREGVVALLRDAGWTVTRVPLDTTN